MSYGSVGYERFKKVKRHTFPDSESMRDQHKRDKGMRRDAARNEKRQRLSFTDNE